MNQHIENISIEIYSDVVCPWCYIGKRRLERALEQLDGSFESKITWRPFELNPTMSKAGMDRRVYLEAKFGGPAAMKAIHDRVTAVGASEGIEFAFDRIARTPRTFDTHRLIWFAQQQGMQDDLVESLFHSYFTEGRDIGDASELVDIASKAGLGSDAVRKFLANSQGVEEVRSEEAEGRRMGIRGVPYYVLNGRYALSGAQPPDVFVSSLRKAEHDLAERKVGP